MTFLGVSALSVFGEILEVVFFSVKLRASLLRPAADVPLRPSGAS